MAIVYRPRPIWITRSAPFGSRIARECRSEGLPALAVPVLQIHPLSAPPSGRNPDAILFTSAQGVRLHHYRSRWKDVPVLAVGDRTAEEALGTGYADVRSAAGNVEDLKALIAASVPAPARILLFGAKDAAGDLEDFLKRSGYEVERCIVYEVRGSSDFELRHAIDLLDRIEGICVYSPKGARRVAELLHRHAWRGDIFCLSQACADHLEPLDWLTVLVAGRPDDRALRQLVRCTWQMSRSARCEDSGRAPSFGLRDFRSAARPRIANDNRNAGSRQFALTLDGEDEDPPPTAA
jgi:uroporphyrinogen-III synthase